MLTKAAQASDDIVLNKGDIAPFDGALVPVNNYRQYQKDRELTDFVKQHQDMDIVASQTDEPNRFVYLAIGFCAGVLLVVIK